MNWNTILAWVQANWWVIATVLSVVIAVVIEVARGNGKELAAQVVALLTAWSKEGLAAVTKEEVAYVAAYLYDKAPDRVGPIPWKALIGKPIVQGWAWDAWQKAIALLGSEKGIGAKRGLNAQRKMRGRGVVGDGS